VWEAPLGHEHPLLGRIWSPGAGEVVPEAEALARVAHAETLLLGEKHDNPDHHRLQAELLAAQRPASVVLEMLDLDQDVSAATTPAELATTVGWEESGWPEFAMYEPVFAQAYGLKARVVPGNPPHDLLMAAMRGGLASLPPDDLAGMDLSATSTPSERERLEQDIVASHCGHAPAAMVNMMVQGQELKDRSLARALEQALPPRALIAGHGHTRRDGGVPVYLSSAPLVVHFQEVGDEALTPSEYDLAGADLVWFTARVDDLDPCERFQEELKAMGQHAPTP